MTKNELYHFGVKGQKWGLRQWQNKDGSLTEAGRKHYGYGSGVSTRKEKWIAFKDAKQKYKLTGNKDQYKQSVKKIENEYSKNNKALDMARYEQHKAYVNTLSTGNRVVKFLLIGPAGSYRYNELRANGTSRGEAIVDQLLFQVGGAGVSVATAGTGSVAYAVSSILESHEESKDKLRGK